MLADRQMHAAGRCSVTCVRKQELPDSWDSHDGAADGGIGGSALRGGSRQAAYSERTMQSLEVPA